MHEDWWAGLFICLAVNGERTVKNAPGWARLEEFVQQELELTPELNPQRIRIVIAAALMRMQQHLYPNGKNIGGSSTESTQPQ